VFPHPPRTQNYKTHELEPRLPDLTRRGGNYPKQVTEERLPEGKIPPRVLRTLLERLGGGAGLDIAPAAGEDAAVATVGSEPRLVLAADPVTFPTADPGWHAVIVNANDVAATGGECRWFLSHLLAPPGTTEDRIAAIAEGVRRGCEEVGAVAAGGHTEITSAVTREVVAGTMVGVATSERIKPAGGAQEGDMLVVTKGIAVEATAIVAAERSDEVRRVFGDDFQRRAAGFATEPGISVVAEARVAAGMLDVHAMHDVTEGGIATAVREMADAAELGVVLAEAEIPRFYESKRLMTHFGLDILGAIGSGALLIACAEPETGTLLERLQEAGTPGYAVGRFVRRSAGIRLVRGSVRREMPVFAADELTRLG
jgi:hydrogenase maturation factor